MIRKEITPNVPQRLSKRKPASIEAEGEIIPGITVTEEMKDVDEARMEKY